MRKKFGAFFPLVFSAFLHLVVASCCFLQITAKSDPSFYNWSNILSHQDLFFEEKEVFFSRDINFSSDNIRRKYFASCYLPGLYSHGYKEDCDSGFVIPDTIKTPLFLGDLKNEQNYVYLWERGGVSSSREKEENISYRAYVSSYGKILFLYPEKLPINSYGSLHLQKYIREAAFFLDSRFFWTKLEGIVK